MVPLALLALLAFPSTLLVSAAPFTIGDDIIFQNGGAAQTLNAQFLTLSANSSCTVGESACIGTSFATCTSTNGTDISANSTMGAWQTEDCPVSQQCFALPFVRSNGTYVSCATIADAEALILVTGAFGGTTANNLTSSVSNSSTVAFPFANATDIPTTIESSPSSNITSSFNSTDCSNPTTTVAGGDNGTVTCTIVVTLTAGRTATFSSETTIDFSAASSLISSLTHAGAAIVTSVPTSTSTGASVSKTAAGDGDSTIIRLAGASASRTLLTSAVSIPTSSALLSA